MLRLEGLLQAWGEDAKWDYRPTQTMPTKSAVVGLLACAMGIARSSPEIVALSQAIKVGVRADRRGTVLEDFHTVQGIPALLNAEGKKRSGNTIVSPRQYLQDASFLAVVQAPRDWRARIQTAFECPKWSVFLGRKSCVPSRPVWAGVCGDYETILDAIRNYPPAPRADALRQYEVEEPQPESVAYTRPDAVIGYRVFQNRSVWRGIVKG